MADDTAERDIVRQWTTFPRTGEKAICPWTGWPRQGPWAPMAISSSEPQRYPTPETQLYSVSELQRFQPNRFHLTENGLPAEIRQSLESQPHRQPKSPESEIVEFPSLSGELQQSHQSESELAEPRRIETPPISPEPQRYQPPNIVTDYAAPPPAHTAWKNGGRIWTTGQNDNPAGELRQVLPGSNIIEPCRLPPRYPEPPRPPECHTPRPSPAQYNIQREEEEQRVDEKEAVIEGPENSAGHEDNGEERRDKNEPELGNIAGVPHTAPQPEPGDSMPDRTSRGGQWSRNQQETPRPRAPVRPTQAPSAITPTQQPAPEQAAQPQRARDGRRRRRATTIPVRIVVHTEGSVTVHFENSTIEVPKPQSPPQTRRQEYRWPWDGQFLVPVWPVYALDPAWGPWTPRPPGTSSSSPTATGASTNAPRAEWGWLDDLNAQLPLWARKRTTSNKEQDARPATATSKKARDEEAGPSNVAVASSLPDESIEPSPGTEDSHDGPLSASLPDLGPRRSSLPRRTTPVSGRRRSQRHLTHMRGLRCTKR